MKNAKETNANPFFHFFRFFPVSFVCFCRHQKGNPSDKFYNQVENKYPMKVGKKNKKKGTIIHTTRTKSFVVTHYAGEVEYNDWKNFYARSVDVLSTHLADTFGRSSNVILSTLFKRKGTENKKP